MSKFNVKFHVQNRTLIHDKINRGPKLWPDNTADALELSIMKYKKMLFRKVYRDGGPTTCALCHIHRKRNIYKYNRVNCSTCPVFLQSGRHGCAGTPYVKLTQDTNKKGNFKFKHKLAELKFLISLRKQVKE